VDVKTKGYYGYEYYGSRKDRTDKGGKSGAGPRSRPDSSAEVTDAPIV